jgi:hypothetical protein
VVHRRVSPVRHVEGDRRSPHDVQCFARACAYRRRACRGRARRREGGRSRRRRPGAGAAARTSASRADVARPQARRARAHHGTIRRRQVNALPRTRRDLAVLERPRSRAAGREAALPAAKALFADRQPEAIWRAISSGARTGRKCSRAGSSSG